MNDKQSKSSIEIVQDFVRLLETPIVAPEVKPIRISTDIPAKEASRPCALIFSPHPDDECLTGALLLRLKQELGWQIVNIVITLGSNRQRRAGRKAELANACAVLGFDAVLPEDDGFSDMKLQSREDDPQEWNRKAEVLAKLISACAPRAIFMPHSQDWNETHEATHLLGMDALALMPKDFSCLIIENEYWQPMVDPNLMIGVGENDVALLLYALACHSGEISRNPYDRRFTALLADNVRRGSERLGGKGAAGADMNFASIYRMGTWKKGKLASSALNRQISEKQPLKEIFE